LGNRKGLVIVTLFIGLIAVGLSGYIIVKDALIPTYSKIEDIYYTERSVPWYPTGTYTDITSIDVTVRQGQNLHILFDSEVILRNSATPETLSIILSYDGIQILSSERTVADIPEITNTRLSLTTMENLLNLDADTYTISVESYGTGTLGSPGGNRIESYSFAIMVYN